MKINDNKMKHQYCICFVYIYCVGETQKQSVQNTFENS
jgi:hypothetical protein